MLTFEVVDADIPNILGMPFLQQVNPAISWGKKFFSVQRGSRRIKVPLVLYAKNQHSKNANFHDADVAKSHFTNSFAGLPIEYDNEPGSAGEEARENVSVDMSST